MADKSSLFMAAPVGTLQLQAHHGHLVALIIHDRLGIGVAEAAQPVTGEFNEPVLTLAASQLTEYFAGQRRNFKLPLDLSAVSTFTRRILETLRAVSYGETLTYGELAVRAGTPRACRAVGRAMATNPLPMIIPCHRVVGAGGRLGGYSGGGGLTTKEYLLALERGQRAANSADFQEKTA